LSKAPDKRYQTGAEMIEALAEALAMPEPKSGRWPIFAGAGLATVVAAVAAAIFWLPDVGRPIRGSYQAISSFLAEQVSSPESIIAAVPTSQADAFAGPSATHMATTESVPTPAPTETDPPLTRLPPATTVPQPAPIADNQNNFSGSQDAANWEYQWSRGRDSFDWVAMQFDGTCWRAPETESRVWEDYVRICPNSAHPGAEGDIAWRWASNISGPIQVRVSARKLDTEGGDGVTILVYRNTAEIKRWQLEAGDGTGFAEQLNLDVAQGDYIFFVIKAGGDATHDETTLRVQIFRR
jgi:hypothetical protein